MNGTHRDYWIMPLNCLKTRVWNLTTNKPFFANFPFLTCYLLRGSSVCDRNSFIWSILKYYITWLFVQWALMTDNCQCVKPIIQHDTNAWLVDFKTAWQNTSLNQFVWRRITECVEYPKCSLKSLGLFSRGFNRQRLTYRSLTFN